MKPSEIIDVAVKEWVKPALSEIGFRKQGHTFWRETGDVVDVITLQKSQWNSSSSASFTVNFGLYWKRVQELLGQTVTKMPPREYDCTVHERIGALIGNGSDRWWHVKPTADASKIGCEVSAAIISCGVPWLERGHSLEQTLEYVRTLRHLLDGHRNAVLALRRDGQI